MSLPTVPTIERLRPPDSFNIIYKLYIPYAWVVKTKWPRTLCAWWLVKLAWNVLRGGK